MVINCVNASLRVVLRIMLFSLLLSVFMLVGQQAVMGSTISASNNPTLTEARAQFFATLDQMYKDKNYDVTVYIPRFVALAKQAGFKFDHLVAYEMDDNKDRSLLNLAAFSGHTKLFKKVIKKYKSPSAIGFELDWNDPLILAMFNSQAEIVDVILKRWGREELYANRNPNNRPMTIAAAMGDISSAQYLIKKKLDPKRLDGHALVVAADNSNYEFIQFLVEQWGWDWVSDEKRDKILVSAVLDRDQSIYNFVFANKKPKQMPPELIVPLALNGRLERLLTAVEEIGLQNIPEETKQKALIYAVGNKQLDVASHIVRSLKIQQIPIEAFFCAVASGDLSLVKEMATRQDFQMSAKATETSCRNYTDEGAFKGLTALGIAQAIGHTEIVSYLKPRQQEQEGVAAARLAANLEEQRETEEAAEQQRVLRRAQAEALVPKYEVNAPPQEKFTNLSSGDLQALHRRMNNQYRMSPNSVMGLVGVVYSLTRDHEDLTSLTSNRHGPSGYIFLAIKYKNNALLAELLQKNRTFEDLKYTFDSPGELAVKHGNAAAVPMMVEVWGEKAVFGNFFKNKPDVRLLRSAVANHHEELVKYLLSVGYYSPDVLKGVIVDAIVAGQRNIAIGCLAAQENIVITTDQYNDIFREAMKRKIYPLAEEVVGNVTEVKQEHLYYAAANGYKTLALCLVSFESIDVTQQADQTYFTNIETKGLTAAEIAHQFGHVDIANLLKAEEDKKFVAENKKFAAKKKAEEQEQREALLALEIPNLGDFNVSVSYRFLGFTGQNRSGKWDYNEGLVKGLRSQSRKVPSLPLNFGNSSNNHLRLYVSQKRGLTVLSSMTNDVSLSAPNGGKINFTFNTSRKAEIDEVALALIQELKKSIEANSGIFTRMRAERDEREIARTAKVKRDRLEKERLAEFEAQVQKTIAELINRNDIGGMVDLFNKEPLAAKYKESMLADSKYSIALAGPKDLRIWDIAQLSENNSTDQSIIALIQMIDKLYKLDFSGETNRVLASMGISDLIIRALSLHEKEVALKIEQQRKLAQIQAEIDEREWEMEEAREREEDAREERMRQARRDRQDEEDRLDAQQNAKDWQEFFDKQQQEINDVVNSVNQSTRATNRIMRQAANQRDDNDRTSNIDNRQFQNFKQKKQQSIERANQEYAEQLALLKREQEQVPATPAQEETYTCYQISHRWVPSEDAAYDYTSFYQNKNTGDKLDTDGAGRPITFEKVYTRKYVHSKKGREITKVFSAAISRRTSAFACGCTDLGSMCNSVSAVQSLIDNEFPDRNFDDSDTLQQ